MGIFNRQFAVMLSAKALIAVLATFILTMVFLWWYEVVRFFLYDHWKPTAMVVLLCIAWYAVGRAIEQFVGRTEVVRSKVSRYDDAA